MKDSETAKEESHQIQGIPMNASNDKKTDFVKGMFSFLYTRSLMTTPLFSEHPRVKTHEKDFPDHTGETQA